MADLAAETENADQVLLRRRAVALATPVAEAAPAHRSEFLLLDIGDRHYALPASRVREILPAGALTATPLGDSLLIGVRATRGGAVVVTDVALLTGDPTVADPQTCLCVVLDDAEPVGILAEAATTVERSDAGSHLESVGDLPGVVAPDGVFLLNVDALLAHPRLRIAPPAPPKPESTPGGTP